MTLILSRRKFLIGAGALFCAPAIIRVADLMPIREWRDDYIFSWYQKTPLQFNGRGLLIEEQRTNLLLKEDMLNGWMRLQYVARRMTNREIMERTKVIPDDETVFGKQLETGLSDGA